MVMKTRMTRKSVLLTPTCRRYFLSDGPKLSWRERSRTGRAAFSAPKLPQRYRCRILPLH